MIQKRLYVAAGVLLMFFTVSSVLANTVTINDVVQDAMISKNSNKIDHPLGTEYSMWLGLYNDGVPNPQEILISFDIAGIADKNIDSAAIRLYHAPSIGHGSSANTACDIDIYEITQSWNEATVTYNSRPAVSISKTVFSPDHGGTGWLEVDVTEVILSWIAAYNTATPYYGLKLHTDDLVRMSCASSEYSTTSQRPQLQVTYTESPPDPEAVPEPLTVVSSALALGSLAVKKLRSR